MKALLTTLTFLISLSLLGQENNDVFSADNKNNSYEYEGKYYDILTDQLFTGWVKIYHENGEIQKKGYAENGDLRDYSIFYDNGQIEAVYENYWIISYYKNGQLRMSGPSMGQINKDNVSMNGILETWHENGQKAGEMFFANGNLCGSRSWYSNGQLEKEQKCGHNCEEISLKCWDETGNPAHCD